MLCVRAVVRGGGSGGSGGSVGNSTVGVGVSNSGGNGGGGGSTGGLRGSGMSGLELEWQVLLEALTGLPALLEEDGGGTTLDFTHVIGFAANTTSRGRDGKSTIRGNLQRGRMAGLAAKLGGGDGPGASGPPASRVFGWQELNTTGYPGGSGGGGGGRSQRPRRVEGFYRDRPALIRAYNVVACLTQRFSRVLLTPGGVNVSGSTAVARSYFPPAGVDSEPQVGGGRREGGRIGAPAVVSVNGWEFGEEPRERMHAIAQTAARNSFDGSGPGITRGTLFAGFGSPRAVEDSRRVGAQLEALAAAPRSDMPAPPVDASHQRDMWKPLWMLVPEHNFGRADIMRPVPNAFEMDAVVWKPGPFMPETDPGSRWLCAARMSALEAPKELLRCV